MKKSLKVSSYFAVLIIMAVSFAGCGGGGGGKSLDNVLAPTDEVVNGNITPYQNEDPEEIADHPAADVGAFDSDPIAAFSNGDTIATSNAKWLDMSTCMGCHSETYNKFLATGHNLAWAKKEASFIARANATPARKYCVQCHTVTAPFLDLNENHIFEAAEGEFGAFGLSPAAATSSTSLVFGGTLGSNSFTSVLDVDDEFKGIQCENCHGPASLHNGDKGRIVSGYQAYSATTCDYCHDQNMEWKKSGHAVAKEASHGSSSCTPCHNAEGFVEYADHVNANTEIDIMEWLASGLKTVDGGDAEGQGAHNINCAACHDPHSKYNEAQLRLPPEKLCLSCHDSRKKIRGSYTSRSASNNQPHHNLQGRILNGKGIINAEGKMLWDSNGFLCDNSVEASTAAGCTTANYIETIVTPLKPTMGDTTCVDCHMYASGDLMGHTFKPRTEACEVCHTSMDASSVIGVMQADYQRKFNALKTRLDKAAAALDTVQAKAEENAGTDIVTIDDVTAAVTAAKITAFQNAEWNLVYLEFDGSSGVHGKDAANYAFTETDKILKSLGF